MDSNAVFWRPLRSSSLMGGSSTIMNLPATIDLTGDDDSSAPLAPAFLAPPAAVVSVTKSVASVSLVEGEEQEESVETHEFEVLPRSVQHLHLLQQWSTTTLLRALKADTCCDASASARKENNVTDAASTAGEPSLDVEPLGAAAAAGDEAPAVISSTATPLVATLILGGATDEVAASSSSSSVLAPTGSVTTCGVLTAASAAEDDDEDESNCVVCFDAVRDCLFLPCKHVVLCSRCCMDYFHRTLQYNLDAALLRADAEREARRNPYPAAAAVAIEALRRKHAEREVHCPCCARSVHLAVRKATTMGTATAGAPNLK
jgi:hypothetical protein